MRKINKVHWVDLILESCSTDEFACLDGSKCIPRRWLCDGDEDCKDASDEENKKCSSRECKLNEFR